MLWENTTRRQIYKSAKTAQLAEELDACGIWKENVSVSPAGSQIGVMSTTQAENILVPGPVTSASSLLHTRGCCYTNS